MEMCSNIPSCAVQSQKGKGIKYAPGHGPTVPEHCPETGSGWIMGGPFWSQPIHDQDWVKGVLGILEVSSRLPSMPIVMLCSPALLADVFAAAPTAHEPEY